MKRFEVRGDLPCEEYESKSGHKVSGGPWYIYDNEMKRTQVTLFGSYSSSDADTLCKVLNERLPTYFERNDSELTTVKVPFEF